MTRRSIVIEGFNHGRQPIPAACRVGNVVMTGGVYGMDPETGEISGSLEDQARLMFIQLRRILSAAGASLEDVGKMTFYLKAREARSAVNLEWLAAFPDPASRPARHTLINEHLPGQVMLQCEAMAVIVDR